MRSLAVGLVASLLVGCMGSPKAGKVIIHGAPDNAGVVVANLSNGGAGERLVTDATGSFTFHGDRMGIISATAEWTLEGTKQVSGDDDGSFDYPEIDLTAAGGAWGYVMRAPMTWGSPGITVTIGDVSVTTDEAGRFVLPTLPLGEQTVTISAVGYHQAQTTVNVAYASLTLLPLIILEPE